MNKADPTTALRLWHLKHTTGQMPFIEEWRWLEQGITAGDLNLRKYCIRTHGLGRFASPQEMLDWIKHGTIPRHWSESPEAGHTKEQQSTAAQDNPQRKPGNHQPMDIRKE